MTEARIGNWIQTYTGRKFWPLDPRPDDIDPQDIAHALSMLCRFGGHVDRFYSVAEHCVLMSYAVSPENALWALLHDASEAYVVDVPRPLKRHLPNYRQIEDAVLLAILDRFSVPREDIYELMPAEVQQADSRILLSERDALMSNTSEPWEFEDLTPLDVTINGWAPYEAKEAYLYRLRELTGE